MKKISSVTLETMRKELTVLEESKLCAIKGGTINKDWSCFFDSLEVLGKKMGYDYDANYYYEEFKAEYGYDPGKVTGHNSQPSTDPTRPSNNQNETQYRRVDAEDMPNALNHFGFSVTQTTNYEYTDGTQMLLLPQANGTYHAVVGEAYLESGMIHYTDPAKGTTGYADPNESGFKMYNIRRK